MISNITIIPPIIKIWTWVDDEPIKPDKLLIAVSFVGVLILSTSWANHKV
jgi:hypothetical protein